MVACLIRGIAMKVGVPKGLLYHKYAPFWTTFLSEIGCEVVESPDTNRPILERGLTLAESEICLPVKCYYGHVAALANTCDAIFVPRVVAVENRAYTCPKFLGLPDMLKATFDGVEFIFPELNMRKGWRYYYRSYLQAAQQLGASTSRALEAILKAERAQRARDTSLAREGEAARSRKDGITIGIAGHAYNVFDSFLSLGLLEKLERLSATVLTPENVPVRLWQKYSARLPKHLFWTYERELIGSALYWLENKLVDGLIYVMSFACGPDSIVQYVLEDEAHEYNIPIMPIVLDEHSGEAGLQTRVEAFVDMITRKKRHAVARRTV